MLVYGTAFTRSRHQDWRFAFFLFLSRYLRCFFHGLYPIFFLGYLRVCFALFSQSSSVSKPTVLPPTSSA